MINGRSAQTKTESPQPPVRSASSRRRLAAPLRSAWTRFRARLRRARRRLATPAIGGFREARYRRLFDGVPIALYLSAPDGTILDVNPALVQLLRYPNKESLLELNAYELFADRSARVRWVAQIEQQDQVRNYEVQLRRYDGELIWVLDYVQAARDPRGRVRFYEGALQDITERKLAAEELQRLNEKLQAAIEASPLAIIALDLDGNVTSWNPAAERIFGWSAAEVIGRPIPVVPVEGREQFKQFHQQLMRGERFNEVEAKRLRRDGSLIDTSISAAPLCDSSGAIVGILIIVADITERKHAEETRLRLAEILEATPDLVGMATVDGAGFYLNPAGYKMLGLAPEVRRSPLPIWDYFPEPDRSRILEEAVPRAILDGTWNGEVTLLGAGGQSSPTSLVIISHKAPNGRADHLSIVARDLTEEKGLERRAQQAQTMDAIGRLAGGIAHDFNNLLTSILGHCDLLLSELKHHQNRDDVREIKEAGERAAALTNRLLAFSRKRVQQPQRIDLNEQITRLGNRLHELAGEAIDIVVDLDPDLDPIKTDPVQLQEIVLSLAENACEAMSQGGRMTIETRRVELTRAQAQQIGILGPGGYSVLSITDTGCGMDEKTKALIFEPFFSTKKEVKGTGLGLPTVYGIVKQSSGEVSVESEPGRGTTVKVYFPAVGADAAVTPTPPTQLPQPGESTTVLLVEDEPAVLALAARVLRGAGYSVLEASDGLEALQVHEVHGGPVDLLITDVVMPRLGGPDLATRLRKACPDLRVIYMSGYTDNKTVRDLMADQRNPFLQKPFTPSKLTQVTRQVLGKLART